MKKLFFAGALSLSLFAFTAVNATELPGSGSGCENKLDNNNGKCVKATTDEGTTYFCKDLASGESPDCVKAE